MNLMRSWVDIEELLCDDECESLVMFCGIVNLQYHKK